MKRRKSSSRAIIVEDDDCNESHDHEEHDEVNYQMIWP